MSAGFYLQSLVIDERSIQVSYFLEEDQDENGVLVRTASMNPIKLRAEVEELYDAAYQLVLAWEGVRRETAVPAPGALRTLTSTTERQPADG